MNFSSDFTQEEDSIAIDLTSLIDVLFVLLLFFMVATTFADVRSVSVNLPTASAKAVEAIRKDLTVTVAVDGSVVISGGTLKGEQVTPIAEIQRALTEAVAGSSESTLVVNADTKTEHGSVVAVLDAAKSAGIKKIAIATQAPPAR